MSFYDPRENIRRLRAGIAEAVRGNPSYFDDTIFPLIAVFTGEPGAGVQSRIVAFQKFVDDFVSASPQVGFIRPACIRVGFNFPDGNDEIGTELRELASTAKFAELCGELGVVQVICGGQHFQFPQRDFSSSNFSGPSGPSIS